MIKILVTGAYCVLNRGDAALRLGGLPSLKRLVTDAEFTIMTPYPEIDSKIYKDGNVVRAIDSPLKAVDVVVRSGLWKIFHDYLGIKYDFVNKLLDTDGIDEYVKSDIVVDISGDSISEVTGFNGTIYHFLHLWLALALNKPTIIYAQSVGPFKFTMSIARILLNKVDLITLRGRTSYDYLQKIGINKPPMYLVADLAFLMEPAPAGEIDRIFSRYKIEGGYFVGLSVSHKMATEYMLYDEYVELMAKITDHITEKLYVTAIFIPHVTGPKNDDDRIVATDIYRILHNKDGVKLIVDDYTPQEMKGIIGRCDLFIGSRMHACIGALSMCVPTVNISYHHKSNDIMAMFGLEKNILTIQDVNLDSLISTINDTWYQREDIKMKISSKIDSVKKQAILNAEYLKSFLATMTNKSS